MNERKECREPAMDDALPALAAGRLRGAERAAVEAHLAGCGACRAALAELEAMRTALGPGRVIDEHRVAAAVVSRTLGAASPRAASAAHAGSGRGPGRWALAAAALFVIALASFGLLHRLRSNGPGAAPGGPPVAAMVPPQASPAPAPLGSGAAVREVALDASLAFATDDQLESVLAALERIELLPSPEPAAALTIDLPEGGS